MVFFAGADWLVGKWIARTIHLRAADETKSRVETLITDHFSVYWKKKYIFLVSLCIQLSFGESGRCLPLLRWIMKGGGGEHILLTCPMPILPVPHPQEKNLSRRMLTPSLSRYKT